MLLRDTLAGKKREFRPLEGNTVRIYTCGPSVYAYAHIGNFRTYLFEDVLVKYLKYKGYGVKRAMNITDVEDKAVDAANEQHVTLERLQAGKIKRFFSDWDALGMERPDVVAKASEHVPEMIALIKRICAKGYCKRECGSTYFDVRKFKRYGKLRHLKKPEYFGAVRKDDYSKEGLWDFRLWKKWTRCDGNTKWKSPFGEGRPGWHVECSAIAMRYLGDSFDIHCGGTDNIFPHHENEIAQSEAATGKRLANFWLHARHLTVDKTKMSKRLGNILYLRQLVKAGVAPKAVRYYLLSERYRNPLGFTKAGLADKAEELKKAGQVIDKINRYARRNNRKKGRALAKKLLSGFETALDDDLNTKLALKRLFRTVEKAGKLAETNNLADPREFLDALARIDSVLGIFGLSKAKPNPVSPSILQEKHGRNN